jgi:hypothetical protein
MSQKSWLKRIGFVGALVLLVGCGTTAAPDASKNSPQSKSKSTKLATVSPMMHTPSADNVQALLDKAQADLDEADAIRVWLTDSDKHMACYITENSAYTQWESSDGHVRSIGNGDKFSIVCDKIWEPTNVTKRRAAK